MNTQKTLPAVNELAFPNDVPRDNVPQKFILRHVYRSDLVLLEEDPEPGAVILRTSAGRVHIDVKCSRSTEYCLSVSEEHATLDDAAMALRYSGWRLTVAGRPLCPLCRAVLAEGEEEACGVPCDDLYMPTDYGVLVTWQHPSMWRLAIKCGHREQCKRPRHPHGIAYRVQGVGDLERAEHEQYLLRLGWTKEGELWTCPYCNLWPEVPVGEASIEDGTIHSFVDRMTCTPRQKKQVYSLLARVKATADELYPEGGIGNVEADWLWDRQEDLIDQPAGLYDWIEAFSSCSDEMLKGTIRYTVEVCRGLKECLPYPAYSYAPNRKAILFVSIEEARAMRAFKPPADAAGTRMD